MLQGPVRTGVGKTLRQLGRQAVRTFSGGSRVASWLSSKSLPGISAEICRRHGGERDNRGFPPDLITDDGTHGASALP